MKMTVFGSCLADASTWVASDEITNFAHFIQFRYCIGHEGCNSGGEGRGNTRECADASDDIHPVCDVAAYGFIPLRTAMNRLATAFWTTATTLMRS